MIYSSLNVSSSYLFITNNSSPIQEWSHFRRVHGQQVSLLYQNKQHPSGRSTCTPLAQFTTSARVMNIHPSQRAADKSTRVVNSTRKHPSGQNPIRDDVNRSPIEITCLKKTYSLYWGHAMCSTKSPSCQMPLSRHNLYCSQD